MEVHHHPQLHHEPKPWKEYFLEFLMIFLAVTLGFIAESLREKIADHVKEREYVQSMIEDAMTDTANIQAAVAINTKRAHQLDTLSRLCFDFEQKEGDELKIYNIFIHCIRHPDFVSPTERTLTQLKNSGGMRLIQNKTAADSIIQYDDFGKKLTDQQVWYENALTAFIESSMHMINYNDFPRADSCSLIRSPEFYRNAKLLNPDRKALVEFGNRAAIYKGIVIYYLIRLQEGKTHAVSLIETLRRQYHIE